MLNKEALEYLVGLGFGKDALVETEQGLFSKVPLHRVNFPKIQSLEVSTLTSLIDYIKDNFDDLGEVLIHVVDSNTVEVLSRLDSGDTGDRDCFMVSKANLPKINYGIFYSLEEFNILLQSSFVANKDRNLLLKFTGLVKDENVKETGDDGISQKVTIKTGVATVGEAVVTNPVTLAPYRTFQEIEQVESDFVFRMREGGKCALFEADGGAWRNETMQRVKDYIVKELEGFEDRYEIIS